MKNLLKKAVQEGAAPKPTSRELIWGRNERLRMGGGPSACPDMIDLGGFLDGTMAAKASRKAMEAHLAQCAVCRREIVDLYLLMRAPGFDAPLDLKERLLALHANEDKGAGPLPA